LKHRERHRERQRGKKNGVLALSADCTYI